MEPSFFANLGDICIYVALLKENLVFRTGWKWVPLRWSMSHFFFAHKKNLQNLLVNNCLFGGGGGNGWYIARQYKLLPIVIDLSKYGHHCLNFFFHSNVLFVNCSRFEYIAEIVNAKLQYIKNYNGCVFSIEC